MIEYSCPTTGNLVVGQEKKYGHQKDNQATHFNIDYCRSF
jgi:hypothetical protein